MTDCLVCQEIAGDVEVPGGALHADEWAVVFHAPPVRTEAVYPGHLLVVARRHALDYADLDDDEAGVVGRQTARWSRALKGLGATRVYVAVVGHGFPHLHVNLLPRWPGTPDDVAWHSIDEWEGSPRASFAEAAELVARLRDLDGR